MKGFSTINGDVVVNKDIEMADGAELLRQKIELVIGTNKGEWIYDTEEGIDFSTVICKNPDENEIRATIEEALSEIDETFTVTSLSVEIGEKRSATINLRAVNADGVEVKEVYTYAN